MQPNTVCTFRIAWESSSETEAKKSISRDWDWESSENLIEVALVVLGITECDVENDIDCIEHIVTPFPAGSLALIVSTLVATSLLIF